MRTLERAGGHQHTARITARGQQDHQVRACLFLRGLVEPLERLVERVWTREPAAEEILRLLQIAVPIFALVHRPVGGVDAVREVKVSRSGRDDIRVPRNRAVNRFRSTPCRDSDVHMIGLEIDDLRTRYLRPEERGPDADDE